MSDSRRSRVSGWIVGRFAGLLTDIIGVGDSVEKVRTLSARSADSVAEAIEDSLHKLVAWLIIMAVVAIPAAIGNYAIGLMAPSASVVVGYVLRSLLALAGGLSMFHGLRIGLLWPDRPWTRSRDGGLRGLIQNPGDLDIVVCGSLVAGFLL